MAAKFDYSVRPLRPSMVLVRLQGFLDSGSSVEVEMALGDYLKNPKTTNIVLDVPQLAFISSSGLRVVMIIIKALVPRGGKLFMVGASAQIVGLIKMSGMTKWIHFRDNLSECD